jgi:endonuclease I
MDDFGIKYIGKENADHLLNALKEMYEVTEDCSGKLYCGISLDWDYKKKTVDLSMPGYIANALHKIQHKHQTGLNTHLIQPEHHSMDQRSSSHRKFLTLPCSLHRAKTHTTGGQRITLLRPRD